MIVKCKITVIPSGEVKEDPWNKVETDPRIALEPQLQLW